MPWALIEYETGIVHTPLEKPAIAACILSASTISQLEMMPLYSLAVSSDANTVTLLSNFSSLQISVAMTLSSEYDSWTRGIRSTFAPYTSTKRCIICRQALMCFISPPELYREIRLLAATAMRGEDLS